jgi:uncharacterized membrane protein SpoIIM required for sporulation
LFMRIGTRMFNREELLNSSLDVLKLRWIGRTFWKHVRGEGKPGLVGWYRQEVFPAVRELGRPALILLVAIVAALIGGWAIGQFTDLRLPAESVASGDQLSGNFLDWYQLGNQASSVMFAIWQNGRVLIAATLLAAISFGVLAVVLTILPFGILGWIFAQFGLLGLDPGIFFAAVIPHSLIEIPAIFLATAAALRLGAIIARQATPGRSIGEQWLAAAADTIKIGVGLVLPLLLLAALVEVYVTPQVVRLALGG